MYTVNPLSSDCLGGQGYGPYDEMLLYKVLSQWQRLSLSPRICSLQRDVVITNAFITKDSLDSADCPLAVTGMWNGRLTTNGASLTVAGDGT